MRICSFLFWLQLWSKSPQVTKAKRNTRRIQLPSRAHYHPKLNPQRIGIRVHFSRLTRPPRHMRTKQRIKSDRAAQSTRMRGQHDESILVAADNLYVSVALLNGFYFRPCALCSFLPMTVDMPSSPISSVLSCGLNINKGKSGIHAMQRNPIAAASRKASGVRGPDRTKINTPVAAANIVR